MARAIWNGSVNFGLVTIPVKLFGATRDRGDLHFHFLHKKDMGRIKNERVCTEDGQKVAWNDVVRGYEYAKGQYVVVTDEDFKKANVAATQSIDIIAFVAEPEIDPLFYDTPYYVEPDKRARHAYALLREALQKSGKVGIARVVLRTREHVAALRPRGDVLVLELLRWPDELVGPEELDVPGQSDKLPAPEMKAATMLIDAMTKPFEPAELHDRYREDLLALIEARAAGKPVHGVKAKAPRTNVLDLMDVLEKSIAQSKAKASPHRPPAKAAGRRHSHKASKKSAA